MVRSRERRKMPMQRVVVRKMGKEDGGCWGVMCLFSGVEVTVSLGVSSFIVMMMLVVRIGKIDWKI